MCVKTRINKLVWDDLSPVRVLLALAETICSGKACLDSQVDDGTR